MAIADLLLQTLTDNPGLTYKELRAKLPDVNPNTVSSRLSYLTSKKLLIMKENGSGDERAARYVPTASASKAFKDQPERKRRRMVTRGQGAVLITLAFGKNRTESLSLAEARTIYAQLHQIFKD
jgi:hypothetical protein